MVTTYKPFSCGLCGITISTQIMYIFTCPYFLNLFFIIVIQRKTNKSHGLFRIVTLQGKNNVW